jgi:hypothetical protein
MLPTDKSGGLLSVALWAGMMLRIYKPCPVHRKPPEEVPRSSEDVPLSAVRISDFLRISDFELRIYHSCPQNRTAKRDASNDYGDCGDYGEYADCGDYSDCSDYGD